MVNRRSVVALSMTVALAWSVALVAQKKDDKKQSDAQKKEIQDIVKIVDGVSAGRQPRTISALVGARRLSEGDRATRSTSRSR